MCVAHPAECTGCCRAHGGKATRRVGREPGVHTPEPGGRGIMEKQEMIHLLSMHPSIHPLIIYPSVHPFIHSSVYHLSNNAFIHPSIHLLSIYPYIYHLSIHSSIHPSLIHLSIYISIYFLPSPDLVWVYYYVYPW